MTSTSVTGKASAEVRDSHHEVDPESIRTPPANTSSGILELWKNKRILGWCKSLETIAQQQHTHANLYINKAS